jgi:hypothetical protein
VKTNFSLIAFAFRNAYYSTAEPFKHERRFICCSFPLFLSALMLNRPTTEERLGKSPKRLVGYFVLVMGIVYTGIGTMLWWTASRPLSGALHNLGPGARRILGTVFIVYGLLRIVRGLQGRFRKKSFSDHE